MIIIANQINYGFHDDRPTALVLLYFQEKSQSTKDHRPQKPTIALFLSFRILGLALLALAQKNAQDFVNVRPQVSPFVATAVKKDHRCRNAAFANIRGIHAKRR